MSDEATIADIRKLEAARMQAMLDNDAAMLDKLLADDLLYTHSNAQSDSKAAYLDKLRAGSVRYLRLAMHDQAIRPLGEAAALVTGRMTAEVELGGTPRSLNNLFATLWHKRNGAWRMVLYQPTPIP